MAVALSPNHVKYGDWQKQSNLGSGGFGQVSLWVNVTTQEKIAIKMCKLQLKERQFQRWQQEVKLMQDLTHESIVSFREVPKDIQIKYVGSFVALGMEFCELGDLRRMLGQAKNCCGLPEHEVRNFLSNIGCGISFLHENGIIHRDIKPENIVMKSKGGEKIQYKITDMGYAKDLNELSCGTSFVGTIHYMAPEFSTTQPLRYTETVDYWSFGLVAFECITGRRPFYPHLDNVLQFLSTLREKKRDEDICTADDDDGNTIFLSSIPQPNALNSVLADKLSTWLQKMLLLDAKLRGGGEGWYKNLQEILKEKHVQVCNTTTNSIVTIAAESKMTVWSFKEKLFRLTSIPVDQQILLFSNGDEPDVRKRVVEQCWHEPDSNDEKIYLFSYNINLKLPRTTIPEKVQCLADASKAQQVSRAVRRLLSLATHFVNNQCRLCRQVLVALFALQKCVDKRYSLFIGYLNDIKKSYYKMLGKLEVCSRGLDTDKEELETLEANQNSEYEPLLDSWHLESEKLKKFQEEDVLTIEQFLSCEQIFANTPYLTRKANEFASRTIPRLSEIVKSCYQHFETIKMKVRKLHDHERHPRPAKEAHQPDNAQELHMSLKELLTKFIQPAIKEISSYSQEALAQIPELVNVIHDLPHYVMECSGINSKITNMVYTLQEDHFKRQRIPWYIATQCKAEVQMISSQFYDAYQRTLEETASSDLADPNPSVQLTKATHTHHSRFNVFMKDLVSDTSMNDLLSLDWDYLHSTNLPTQGVAPAQSNPNTLSLEVAVQNLSVDE